MATLDNRVFDNGLTVLDTEADVIAGNALRWTALHSATQAEWAAYRQALLDVPQQSDFPHSVVWPTKPQG